MCLKGNPTDFTLVYSFRGVLSLWKQLYNILCGSRGRTPVGLFFFHFWSLIHNRGGNSRYLGPLLHRVWAFCSNQSLVSPPTLWNCTTKLLEYPFNHETPVHRKYRKRGSVVLSGTRNTDWGLKFVNVPSHEFMSIAAANSISPRWIHIYMYSPKNFQLHLLHLISLKTKQSWRPSRWVAVVSC